MSKKQIKDKVKKIFVEIFPELRNRKFVLKKNQSDFKDWDSFNHMKLISTLEEIFGIAFDMTETMEADSPLKIIEMIEKKNLRDDVDKQFNINPVFRNISEALTHWSLNASNKIFIKDLSTGSNYSYSIFNKLVNTGVRLLQKQGVRKGDFVLLQIRNSIEFLILYFASMRLGSVINPIPLSVGENELLANMDFIKPKLSFLEKSYHNDAFKKYKVFRVEFKGKNALHKILETFSTDELNTQLEDDSPAVLYYSSGTTGKPKGILFSHRGIMNIIVLMCQGFNHNHESIHLGILPMAHTSVIHHSVLPVLYKGGTFIFSENFIKIRKDFWHIIEHYKINYVHTVPTVIVMILNTPYLNYQRKKIPLEYIACGAAPLPEAVKKSFEKKFGIRLANVYGLSEAGHLMSDYPFKRAWKPGSVGRPLESIDLKIFDDSGTEAAAGIIGEFVVKTPAFFIGYYKDERLYKSSFKNSYFCTGDLGWRDGNGVFYYAGRKKDLIIKGGVNISPNFIDETLIKHPKIAEAASVGKGDKFYGEIIKSFVVLKPGQKISQKEFFDYCKKKLGEFKSPSEIEFVDIIPKTFSGKILRRNLRQNGG